MSPESDQSGEEVAAAEIGMKKRLICKDLPNIAGVPVPHAGYLILVNEGFLPDKDFLRRCYG